MKKTSPEIEAQVIAAYQTEPAGGKTLARRFGIGGTTLYRMLKRNGVPIAEEKRSAGLIHRSALTEEQTQEVIARTNAGERARSIAKRFGICRETVFAILKRRGVVTKIGKPIREVATDEIASAAILYANGLSQEAIAKTFKVSQTTISHWLRLQGISHRAPAEGSRHGSWRGGRSTNAQGYVLILLTPDDPFRSMANVTGYALEHRLVMARHLGRPLLGSESVHHTNGKHDDNRLENLQLRMGKHGKGSVFVCMDCGSHNIRAKELA